MTYTFFINYNSVVTQVFPLNWLETSLVDEKGEGQVFYRRKFEGTLTFGGKKLCGDFEVIHDILEIDPCARIDFLILQGLSTYFEGYFSPASGEWDLDNKTFTTGILTTDSYSDWAENGDIEYNILALPRVTTIYDDGGSIQNYDRTILMRDLIEYLVQQIYPALQWSDGSIQSSFFDDAINPATLATNRYSYLTIAQKSDIIRPTSSNPATIGMMSFNGLMEILKSMNLRWTYEDVFNIFTIEHISFWESISTLDIRTQNLTKSTNKYRYVKEEIPKFENFAWMEANAADFVGLPIWYDSLCVNQDSGSNSTELNLNVTTDIEYIRACVAAGEESKISDEGWVLFATEYRVPDYYITINSGIIHTGLSYFNADLSWGRLHDALFKHDRQLIQGYMNGVLTDFYSARKIKEQLCSITYCTTLDPNVNMTTELGETYFGGEKGDIKKAVIKPYGEINLTLRYGPVGSEIIPIPEQKFIRITEEGICGQLHAVLFPAADDDLEILLGYEILDIDGNFVCGEAAVDSWIIPNGATTADYTLVFDDAGCGGGIPAGGCWNPVTNFTDPESKGWTVFTILQLPECSC